MKQVQDAVVEKVQKYIREYFLDSLNENQIDEVNQELEVKILSAFYEYGITSNPKAHKQ
jgi:hypothetical protein